MSKKLLKHALSFLMLVVLVAPIMVSAQGVNEWFGTNKIQDVNLPTQQPDLAVVAVKIINWVLGFLALIAIVIVLIGGFEWMTAGGSEDKVKTAKKRLTYGLIGLAIIFLAWAIVRFVLTQFSTWAG